VIAGPPPGHMFQLVARWRKFIGHWMLERLSPPQVKPRRAAEPEPIAKPTLAAAVDGPREEPSTDRSGTVEPMRRRTRG
jgi:hypothetical protein